MTAESNGAANHGRFAKPRSMRAVSLRSGWVSTMLLALCCHAARGELAGFVTVDGTSLRDAGGPLRFVSFNVPNLLIIEDAFGFERLSPWRWPDDFELTDAFRSLRQMGATVARSYVITVRRDDSDMGEYVHVRGPGDFNEEAFRAMDRMLAAANREGIRVIVPLVDNWKWQGGGPQYAGFRGKPPEAFWTDPEVIADFKQTIRFVLTRRNTVTRVRYADDPAILGWETGNELDSPPEWTREIAATIKSLDSNHLVIDGNSLRGVPTTSLAEPLIDVVTSHHYPSDQPMAERVAAAIAAAAGKKAFFVGEAGFVPLAEIQDVVSRVVESEAAGILLWSLRFRSRDGGFYWHSEPNNLGRFKAYHWPGFPSGEAYDEAGVMGLVRRAAHALRGVPVQPLPRPDAPEMLPSSDVAAISWRGVAGATHYHVERARAVDGPWEVVADAVREDRHPYRPLFFDETAPVAAPLWYRVTAVNEAGASPPSAAIGPIVPAERVLVDEFDGLDRAASASSGVEIVTANPRATQEDLSRALVPPGGSLTYHISTGGHRLRLFLFAEKPDQPLEITANEKTLRRPVATQRQCVGAAGGDYGYLLPIIVTAHLDQATTIEISVPSGGVVQFSRLEIRHGR
jgi:mannan endo-1,4-beta-mannosidase